MHTFLHVLLWIWQTFGRVQRIRRLWFVSYTYVFFQTDGLCCSFVQVEGYKSFWVSVTSAVSRYLCVWIDCGWMLFQSVLWGSQGYRVMWWAKETGWHSERIFTLLFKCCWGERSSSHWCEAERSRQTKSTHKQSIIIHILFHSSGLWFHSSLLFSVKVLLNHDISAKSCASVCVSFTVCSCTSCCVVENLISEGNINAVKSLVLPCCPAS